MNKSAEVFFCEICFIYLIVSTNPFNAFVNIPSRQLHVLVSLLLTLNIFHTFVLVFLLLTLSRQMPAGLKQLILSQPLA